MIADPIPAEPTPPPPAVRPAAHQGTLFGPPAPRVIPFPKARREAPAAAEAKAPPAQRTETVRRSPRKTHLEGQQSLEFVTPPVVPVSKLSTPHIYCDAPVASASLRMMAAGIDAGIMLIGLLLFAVVFSYWGGPVVLNSWTTPCYAAAALLVAFLYRALWWIAQSDTAGMRIMGLRLVDFDGYEPDGMQRIQRVAASLLSVAAAGLGLLWGLADEESLTWHDHISKTFPTLINQD